MEEQLISQVLDELAQEAVPEDTDLWPSIRRQVKVRNSPNGRHPDLRLGLLVAPPLRGAGLALTLALVVALGLFSTNVKVDVVEFLGLDDVLVQETATLPAYGLTVTPVVTPSLSVAAPSISTGIVTETTTTLVIENTPLPTQTGAN